MCNACQTLDQLLDAKVPCGHTGDARVMVSDPNWNAGTPRKVTFYRSTRPQAPKYAKLPENVGKVECSICRHTFIEDTPEAKKAHKAVHLTGHWTVVCPVCDEDVCNHPECIKAHAADCSVYANLKEAHTC